MANSNSNYLLGEKSLLSVLLCGVCGLCGCDVAGDSPVSLQAILLTVYFSES